MVETAEAFTYHGYRLQYVTDGVAIRYGSDLVDIARSMSDARSLIDEWRDAK